MMRLVLCLVLAGLIPASSLAFGPFRRRSSKPNPGFLFDAMNLQRDASLTREEFAVFLEPDRFRPLVLRQIRYKMGFFGKLPGMQGLLDSAGGEPPFAKKNHANWVSTYDSDGDGVLNSEEHSFAVAQIFQQADEDLDGVMSREEFSTLLERRQRELGEEAPQSAEE